MNDKIQGDKPPNKKCHEAERNSDSATHNNGTSGTNTGKDEEKAEKAPMSYVRWSLLFEAILVIATCATVGVARSQWKVMEVQSQIMKEQLIAMSDQTKAAYQQVSTAKSSIRIADKTLKDAQESGKEQSERAEKSLNAAIENFRLDQRAWVGIDNLAWDEYKDGDKTVCIKEGAPFKVGVHIKNTGKTPASLSTTRAYVYPTERGKKPILQENSILSTLPTNSTLFPGGRLNIGVTKPIVYTKEQIELIKNGQYTLYLVGMIVYKDVFGKTHFTKFCNEVSTDLTRFEICTFDNEAN